MEPNVYFIEFAGNVYTIETRQRDTGRRVLGIYAPPAVPFPQNSRRYTVDGLVVTPWTRFSRTRVHVILRRADRRSGRCPQPVRVGPMRCCRSRCGSTRTSMNRRTRSTTSLSLALMFLALGCTRLGYEQMNDPERDAWQHPKEVIDALKIEPGAVVADLGAGGGYFTFRLSDAVGPR